jgi:hypothetical protein
MATKHQLKTFAHHQAAHAVAHYYLKIGFKSVTLENSEPHFTSIKGRGAYTEAHIIACYAGMYAQRKAGHRGRMTHNSVVDFELGAEMWDDCADDDHLCDILQRQLAQRRAEVLVELHWPDIQKVAQALLDRKRLSHAEVVKAIRV